MKTSSRLRSGWTLIELMVVIALMTLVLSGSATLLTAVLRSQRSLWTDLQEQSARTRLAAQLRADAHGARSVRCASPQVCDFELAGGETVHYENKGSSLLRERRQSDAVSQRESFPLNGLSAAFSVDASRQRPLIRLTMEAVPEERKYSGIAPFLPGSRRRYPHFDSSKEVSAMRRNSNKLCRRAAAMMMALVVLLVVGMVSGLALRAILQSHRQTRQEEQRMQAELLADAALSRAISLLQQDATWKGENWAVNLASVPAEIAEGHEPNSAGAAVTLVERIADEPNSRRISVTAIYPNVPIYRAQALRELTYTVPQQGEMP